MHIFDAARSKVELELLEETPEEVRAGPVATAGLGTFHETSSVARATRAFFHIGPPPLSKETRAAEVKERPPAVFRERATGLIRTVYREIVVRFTSETAEQRRAQILEKFGFQVRRTNRFIPVQVVIAHPDGQKYVGAELLRIANALVEMEEVVFATPNFVSEYRRHQQQNVLQIPGPQWHLRDIHAPQAWQRTTGERSIVVAILDDGVDVDHPALRRNVSPEQIGRDFFVPDDHPDHYNPRPKRFQFPYDQTEGNDIHGTPCAGVAAAVGDRALGIAPACRILPVKIFHGSDLAADERVADAIRYAASCADILSCSWSGGTNPDVELALEDAGRIGRNGRGSAVFCAAGNENGSIGFPASNANTIAVGACTDAGRRANYSNHGPKLDLVAPSSGGSQGIFTTDVS